MLRRCNSRSDRYTPRSAPAFRPRLTDDWRPRSPRPGGSHPRSAYRRPRRKRARAQDATNPEAATNHLEEVPNESEPKLASAPEAVSLSGLALDWTPGHAETLVMHDSSDFCALRGHLGCRSCGRESQTPAHSCSERRPQPPRQTQCRRRPRFRRLAVESEKATGRLGNECSSSAPPSSRPEDFLVEGRRICDSRMHAAAEPGAREASTSGRRCDARPARLRRPQSGSRSER
jgi:hypothetical protein